MDPAGMERGKEKQRKGARKEKATERPTERERQSQGERGLEIGGGGGGLCLKVPVGPHSSQKGHRVHGILM